MIDQEEIGTLNQPEVAQSDTQRSLDEAAKVRYLVPEEFILFRNDAGGLRLTLKDEMSYLWVKARLTFPFSFPTKYISLRSGADDEIGIIRDLKEIPKEYRAWIEDELELRYFTPRLQSISMLKRRYGGVEWRVMTDRGPKRFLTRGVNDSSVEIERGRYIVTDFDGNRYELTIADLDVPSQNLLATILA